MLAFEQGRPEVNLELSLMSRLPAQLPLVLKYCSSMACAYLPRLQGGTVSSLLLYLLVSSTPDARTTSGTAAMSTIWCDAGTSSCCKLHTHHFRLK